MSTDVDRAYVQSLVTIAIQSHKRSIVLRRAGDLTHASGERPKIQASATAPWRIRRRAITVLFLVPLAGPKRHVGYVNAVETIDEQDINSLDTTARRQTTLLYKDGANRGADGPEVMVTNMNNIKR